MKAGIVGGGAVGSLFASFFNAAGRAYSVYEKDVRAARALAEGLTVRMPSDDRVFRSEASGAPDILSSCDVVFLFVKSYSTGEAMDDIAPFLRGGAVVVSLQNGIGNRETVERLVPPERVVSGSVTIGATRVDERTVVYGGSGSVVIGGPNAGAVESVRALLESANVPVETHGLPDEVIWRKAVINAAINPLGALLGVPNGRLLELPDALIVQESVIKECVPVAAAKGIALDAVEMMEATREVCRKTAANLCSMLQDLRAGRRTEIDSINGAFARLAREAGVAAPYNELLARLVRAKEREAAS